MRHPDPDEIDLMDVMGALNDPTRVGLVRVLADGREQPWGNLRVPVAKSTLSHHLRTLHAAGITRGRQEGTRCWVTLRRNDLDARFPGLLDALLDAAERDGVGDHVGLAGGEPSPDRHHGLAEPAGAVADC
ncbi:transcriptional regulator [Streptomyces sp. TS71-3]|nr:transcriptional regulator [Streptomyces sp. TS71-3]